MTDEKIQGLLEELEEAAGFVNYQYREEDMKLSEVKEALEDIEIKINTIKGYIQTIA